MNALEYCTSIENGLHCRNGAVCVMLRKKLRHPSVEKFVVIPVESNGCGKGVGKTGGSDGTVGIVELPLVEVATGGAVLEAASEAVVTDVAEPAAEVLEADGFGKEIPLAVCGERSSSSTSYSSSRFSWGSCILLCQSSTDSASIRHPCDASSAERTSRTAGCDIHRVERVMIMSTIGTTSIENFSRRASRRFFMSVRRYVSSMGAHGFSGVE